MKLKCFVFILAVEDSSVDDHRPADKSVAVVKSEESDVDEERGEQVRIGSLMRPPPGRGREGNC